MHVRIAWGTGTAPTETASYDAALADATVHNYNLTHFSSVLPEGTTVEPVGSAPPLGPVGGALRVVQARATVDGGSRAAAGLAWAQTPSGKGLLYESAGETDAETIGQRLDEGISHGRELRDWPFERAGQRVVSVDANDGEYATAVVVAAYGDAEPLA